MLQASTSDYDIEDITELAPETLIQAVNRRPDLQDLTAVSNNAGIGNGGLGMLFGSLVFHRRSYLN